MSTQGKRRVLIVDNDEDVLSSLGRELTQAGYETTTTWSGAEALSLLKTGPFDSLLVDNYLPDLYIGEFLQLLSGLPTCPRIFVMHSNGIPALKTNDSVSFQCVHKGRVSNILQALADEEGEESSQTWIH